MNKRLEINKSLRNNNNNKNKQFPSGNCLLISKDFGWIHYNGLNLLLQSIGLKVMLTLLNYQYS